MLREYFTLRFNPDTPEEYKDRVIKYLEENVDHLTLKRKTFKFDTLDPKFMTKINKEFDKYILVQCQM